MKNIIRAIICLSAIVIWQTAQTDDFINSKPLLKDSVPTNPGLETITPLLNFRDTDSDGYPDKVVIAYKVWAAGTYTKLFTTVARPVALPKPACNNPIEIDKDEEIRFLKETGGRTHMLLQLSVYCTESGTFMEREASKSIVYSAQVSKSPAAGGTSWLKAWNKEAMSFDMVDWDNDSQKEIILTLVVDQASSADARVIAINQPDGVIKADNKYRIVNEF